MNTLGFASTAVFFSLLFAVPTAWLVERTDCREKILSSFVTSAPWCRHFFTAMGWVSCCIRASASSIACCRWFGLNQAPFNIASMIGMGWVEGLGYPLSLSSWSSRLTQHGSGAGRSRACAGLGIFRTLRYVTLPLTFPGIIAASIYVFTIGLSAFEVPAIIGMSNKILPSRPLSFTKFSLSKSSELRHGRRGEYRVDILALLLSWSYFGILRFSHRYAVVTGKGYRPRSSSSVQRSGFSPGLFSGFILSLPSCCHFFC